MSEAAGLLGALSMCVFWTAWREKKHDTQRDSRCLTVTALVMMASAFAVAAL